MSVPWHYWGIYFYTYIYIFFVCLFITGNNFFFPPTKIIEVFPVSKGAQIYDNFGSDKLWLRLKKKEI